MGGLARRVGYEKALSKLANGKAAILNVDAGHIFTDALHASGMMDDPRAKNAWMLRAFETHRVAAINVSPRDLPYLAELTAKADLKKNVAEYPALARFVSANVSPANDKLAPFAPYRIEEIKSDRIGKQPLRVGFLGLSELPRRPLPDGVAYRIDDPVETARKIVPELRKKVDLLVVLAYVDRETAKRIGRETEGIDLVIAAHQFPLYNGVDEAGDAVVAYAMNETKYLGEVRFYKEAGTSGPITKYAQRTIPLDEIVPSDASALEVVEKAKKAFTRTPPSAAK
jgi:2',3'-cyclic-nucleotide 2'-phosphodiesterase (5'-nucleotidase family)